MPPWVKLEEARQEKRIGARASKAELERSESQVARLGRSAANIPRIPKEILNVSKATVIEDSSNTRGRPARTAATNALVVGTSCRKFPTTASGKTSAHAAKTRSSEIGESTRRSWRNPSEFSCAAQVAPAPAHISRHYRGRPHHQTVVASHVALGEGIRGDSRFHCASPTGSMKEQLSALRRLCFSKRSLAGDSSRSPRLPQTLFLSRLIRLGSRITFATFAHGPGARRRSATFTIVSCTAP